MKSLANDVLLAYCTREFQAARKSWSFIRAYFFWKKMLLYKRKQEELSIYFSLNLKNNIGQ